MFHSYCEVHKVFFYSMHEIYIFFNFNTYRLSFNFDKNIYLSCC